MGLISFPMCYVLFILHILRNASSFALHILSEDIMLMTLAAVNSVARHCFIHLYSGFWKWIYVRKIETQSKRKERSSGSELEGYI